MYTITAYNINYTVCVCEYSQYCVRGKIPAAGK